MVTLRDLFAPQRRLLLQEREIKALREELQSLRSQNASMREGMRRCVTCNYRKNYKNPQGGASGSSG